MRRISIADDALTTICLPMDATLYSPLHIAGPLLPGIIIAAIFFGSATIQACIYFGMFRKDSWKLKSLVISNLSVESRSRS
ncbi:hypothetical protein BV22DRAFT_869508 [Leucogyrophana mollusca]|uniref:Uncharacterized protein n=1 Tax=Leucogyrophana mollusca TaxID=85980 RepID=A0ACB8B0R2_9AGAM|nr:hypothetical protein BV22DRAFT_869508 [Leucogyrophana mollusca]